MTKDKEIRKNREALIRYFYSLPEPDRGKYSNYGIEGEKACLCAKGQIMKKFLGTHLTNEYSDMGYYNYQKINYKNCDLVDEKIPSEIQSYIELSGGQWREMEMRYEGRSGIKKHSYSDIAHWLQTLPGWPQVL